MRKLKGLLIGVCLCVFFISNNAFSKGLYEVDTESNFSYEKLQRLIRTKDLRSVEETLESIKIHYPEFFKNYVLMYHSRSLQGSSFMNPRAILFDRSGQFVFTFNGNEEQRGYKNLEIMQFYEDTSSFEFREISFLESQRPVFSKANPEKCLACHQRISRINIDARPNWEPYSVWPGAYGSISGNTKVGNFHRNSKKLNEADPIILENALLEEEKIKKFFSEVQGVHPRYKFLDKSAFEARDTVLFTEIQNTLGFKRIARIITKDLFYIYNEIKETIASGAKCREFYVSEKAYNWLSENWGFEEFNAKPARYFKEEDVFEDESLDYSRKRTEYVSLKKKKKVKDWSFPNITMSEFFHHIFEPLGISTADWSQDFKTGGSLAFRERFGTPSNTRKLFLNAMRKKLIEDGLNQMTCEELVERSVVAFDKFMTTKVFKELMNKKEEADQLDTSTSLLDRCIGCHDSEDSDVPFIPFSKSDELKTYLLRPAKTSEKVLIDEIKYRLGDFAKEEDRMPLGPLVTKKQRDYLIDYLEKFLAD